ncbi:MAG: hypothetical protein SVU88_03660 [Candidatus Nanohaloarchaea archaeon]|nr:hypothetical protein [Candidatus Nanohaloarchaea archaeon]
MEVYIGHSTIFDYREELYQPLESSKLSEEHNLVFPHKDSEDLFDTKEYLQDSCDVFVADVSEASTGLGIELGWANLYDIPIIAIHRIESDISQSISEVADEITAYDGDEEMVKSISVSLARLM